MRHDGSNIKFSVMGMTGKGEVKCVNKSNRFCYNLVRLKHSVMCMKELHIDTITRALVLIEMRTKDGPVLCELQANLYLSRHVSKTKHIHFRITPDMAGVFLRVRSK